MENNPTDWMRESVEEWERQQITLEVMKKKKGPSTERTVSEKTRGFLQDEVDIFRSQIGARIEQEQKTESRLLNEETPAEIRTPVFMGKEVETFKVEVAQTLQEGHKRTCSTCNPAINAEPEVGARDATMVFMKNEVEEFKEKMGV